MGGVGAGGAPWGVVGRHTSSGSNFAPYQMAFPQAPGLSALSSYGFPQGSMSPYLNHANPVYPYPNGGGPPMNPGSGQLPPSNLNGADPNYRRNSGFNQVSLPYNAFPNQYHQQQFQQYAPAQHHSLHPSHSFPHQQQQQQMGLLSQSHGFNPNSYPDARFSHPGAYHPYGGPVTAANGKPVGPHSGHHHQHAQHSHAAGINSSTQHRVNSGDSSKNGQNGGGNNGGGGFGVGDPAGFAGQPQHLKRSAGSSMSTASASSFGSGSTAYNRSMGSNASSIVSPPPLDDCSGEVVVQSIAPPLTYDPATGEFVAYTGRSAGSNSSSQR
ncbi:hypothetical protein DFJ73DRAFT_840766 [Zopfochytrium polystomum]|nr:hypothetical protein DFJ73DRAFT_840766 [Zopfochytrium polystomum]